MFFLKTLKVDEGDGSGVFLGGTDISVEETKRKNFAYNYFSHRMISKIFLDKVPAFTLWSNSWKLGPTGKFICEDANFKK